MKTLVVHKRGLCRLADYGYIPEGGNDMNEYVFSVDEGQFDEIVEHLNMQGIPWRTNAD